MQRRDILKTKATGLAAGAGRVAAKAQTFVLVHGAWLSKDVTLDTFTKDIVNADAMPDKVRHLVYLDSLMVEGGKRPFDNLAPATTPW